MNFLKKATTILILSVFIMSQIGHHLIFTLAKWNAKYIISQHLKSNIIDDLVEKIPNSNAIHWEEKNKEFELSGQMYDVVKTEEVNNKTIYYCINDQKESGLLQIYSNWIQSGSANDQQKQNAKSILKFTQIECDVILDKDEKNQSYSSLKIIPLFNLSLISRSLMVEGPPPKNFI